MLLWEQGIPMVMINAAYEELNASYICLDDVKVGFMAAEYLIKGHQRLLFITKSTIFKENTGWKVLSARVNSIMCVLTEDIITFTTETRETIAEKQYNGWKKNKL